MVNWVIDSWQEVSPAIVSSSFQHCGNIVYYLYLFLIGINLDLNGKDHNLLNSKLRAKAEIQSYLEAYYKNPNINPHDDRDEISKYIDDHENFINYDIDNGEDPTSANENQYINALDDQRKSYDDEVAGIGQDEDPLFFEDTQE